MKAIKNSIIILMGLVVILQSCKKDPSIESNSKTNKRSPIGLFNTGPSVYDGYVIYTAQCESWRDTSNAIHHRVYYQGNANFYDNPISQGLNVGNVSWGSIVLQPDSVRYGRWTYAFTHANSIDSTNTSQFGGTTSFAVAGGSGFSNTNISMYVPEEIYLIPENYNCATSVIKSSLLPKQIFWNKDANNQEGVEVMIEYNGFRSNLKNSSFSSASFFNDPVNVPDNGMCSITSTMLTGIPFGSIITIHVGRSTEKTVTDASGKVVVVTGMAYTSQDYVYEQ